MSVKQFDLQGQENGQVELNPTLFAQELNPQIIAQYVHVHRQRRALGTKKTKSRGEVAGGGHKPWRQKGTGRARHGSIRSPLWVGGGHAHPISPQMDRRVRISKPMRQKALITTLSMIAQEDRIIILDNISFETPKTKSVIELLKKLSINDQSVLIVVPQKNTVLSKSVANIPTVRIIEARLLNPVALLNSERVVFLKESLTILEEVFGHAK